MVITVIVGSDGIIIFRVYQHHPMVFLTPLLVLCTRNVLFLVRLLLLLLNICLFTIFAHPSSSVCPLDTVFLLAFLPITARVLTYCSVLSISTAVHALSFCLTTTNSKLGSTVRLQGASHIIAVERQYCCTYAFSLILSPPNYCSTDIRPLFSVLSITTFSLSPSFVI